MNAASLEKRNLRGVTKRQGTGTRSRVTRNRSKVEKIRESLKNLKLDEKQIKPTRNKVFRGDQGSQDSFHDLGVQISNQELSVQISKLPLGAYSCSKLKAEKSQVRRSERTKAKCDSPENRPGMFNCSAEGKDPFLLKERDQLKIPDSDCNDECQTPQSCSSMSEAIGTVDDSLKRKCDDDLKETNFNIDKDQCSPSPPNSPLYDMPPPSTPAQKQARREKRHLQLERWKRYEASRSRQERYQRRAQEAAKAMQKSVSMVYRRVQWSDELVQTVYIDDHEPNLMDYLMV
ncbi:uncharacterized protein LOC144646784 [Oculina patagonica]